MHKRTVPLCPPIPLFEVSMKQYLFIAVGGLLGATARMAVENAAFWNEGGAFPFSTLLINCVGSFLLALLLTLSFDVLHLDPAIRLGLTTGLLGAFTTFSTFCKESVSLLDTGQYGAAAAYLILSPVLGLAAAFLGIIAAREWIKRSLPAAGEAE